MNKYLSKTSNTENILSWKSKGMSDDVLKPLNNTALVPQVVCLCYYSGTQTYFKGSCVVNENNFISNEKSVKHIHCLPFR